MSYPGNSVLQEVSLWRNHLTGSLSKAWLESPYDILDLSHNHLSGTISDHDSRNRTAVELTLKVNRLSGRVPDDVENIKSLDILVGNICSCNPFFLPDICLRMTRTTR